MYIQSFNESYVLSICIWKYWNNAKEEKEQKQKNNIFSLFCIKQGSIFDKYMYIFYMYSIPILIDFKQINNCSTPPPNKQTMLFSVQYIDPTSKDPNCF